MNKAAQLAARLERLNVAEGMKIIEASNFEALHFDVIVDTMCIMHSDGSVNLIGSVGGRIGVEVISAPNVLKVLKHYRPFKEVFKGMMQ